MSTKLYRERKAKLEAEEEGGRDELARATLPTRLPRRRGLRPGSLKCRIGEALVAVKRCRRCRKTAMVGEIYLQSGRGHLCPGCAALTPRQRSGRVMT